MKYYPRNKTMAAGIGLPVAVIGVWLIETFAGVKVPAEVAAAIGSVASVLLAFVAKGSE